MSSKHTRVISARTTRCFAVAAILICPFIYAAPHIYSTVAVSVTDCFISPEFEQALDIQGLTFKGNGVQIGQPMPTLDAIPITENHSVATLAELWLN